ncbi:MAG: hypothetical protein AAF333_18685 [Planctomycetota bacterium]
MSDQTPEDLNQAAHRIVNRDISEDEKLPADIEAAWEQWIDQIQNIDGRAFHLLRAAFEAGYEAAHSS